MFKLLLSVLIFKLASSMIYDIFFYYFQSKVFMFKVLVDPLEFSELDGK